MKLDILISELRSLMSKYGNIEVVCSNSLSGDTEIQEVIFSEHMNKVEIYTIEEEIK